MADESTQDSKARGRSAAAPEADKNERTVEADKDENGQPLSQQASAERSLTDTDKPFVVKTVDDESGDDEATPPIRVNGSDGDEIDAGNGLPYRGVSEDWVRLQPKAD